MNKYLVTELVGDGISTELAKSVRQVLASLPCATIPGINTYFTRPLDVDIVRVAKGGTYED